MQRRDFLTLVGGALAATQLPVSTLVPAVPTAVTTTVTSNGCLIFCGNGIWVFDGVTDKLLSYPITWTEV